ncbi:MULTISPECIES: potassium transporter Kup [Burkholderiaceae]|nr:MULTISPECIES: potassium transporter Kup [Burkholderiaceae]SAL77655.1 potassium transporter Kup [Caballeronia peredens]
MSASTLNMSHPKQGTSALAFGAIGVVFGDIGTSPLYTLRECLKAAGGVSQTNVFGVVSLILWSILVVVTFKYVCFVMRADSGGEGGILTLATLSSRAAPRHLRSVLLVVGVFGAAMFYGDSMITPAVSVVSAVEGLSLVSRSLTHWIVPVSLAILICLFAIQRFGTGLVGKLFAPVMVTWFLILAALGVLHVVQHPTVLEAALPSYAFNFVADNPKTAFVVLGSVFLALTGGEALYADMGHFGKKPIRLVWLALVLPSLVINYFGQAALVLSEPSAAQQPFFMSAPGWALIPLVALAAGATVIASQAVISGAFSMTNQAVQLGLLPRLSVVHTSTQALGQVFVPFVNRSLCLAVILLVLLFRSSGSLASAYGIAVASTMLLTTVLMFVIARTSWCWSRRKALGIIGPLAMVDVLFVSSNARKVVEGGWFPLLAGTVLFTVLMTWHHGRAILIAHIKKENPPLRVVLRSLLHGSDRPTRVEGTAVFPTSVVGVTPTAFMHNLKHNRVLHDTNIFIAGTTEAMPFVDGPDKAIVESLGRGCFGVRVRHGWMEVPDLPAALRLVEGRIPCWHYDVADTSFFLARDSIRAQGGTSVVTSCREKLFAFLARNTAHAAEYYSLPASRVVELGGQINLSLRKASEPR